ncbi:MMPL family transporter [Acidianus infernus]|uniref:MMPL family transporter n=1 Tax=Acidianus infernus TaxID=12915 RepID=A0A6A9QIU3_ACIIN|nr:MMPL family transporter [Acidianus infernus]MUM65190.1 MMPL family transporter [Acidianus infernus]
MNSRFSEFISKKWYIVLIIWIVVLAISAPFSSLFFKSVSYQINISTPGSTSAQAENIVSKYFHLQGASGANAILIIEGNVTPYSLFLANLTSYGNITIISYYSLEKSLLNTTLSKLQNSTNSLYIKILEIKSGEIEAENNLSCKYIELNNTIVKLEELNCGTKKIEVAFINVSNEINETAIRLYQLHQGMLNNLSTFCKIKEGEIEINSTAYNVSLFLYGYTSLFLKEFLEIYNETHNFTYSSEKAFEEVSKLINNENESKFFYAFYKFWLENNYTNFVERAQISIKNASLLIPNNSFILSLENYINISNFEENLPYYEFTVNYINETIHVPLELAEELYYNQPKDVLLTIYSEKTGLNETFLQKVLNQTNFKELAYDLILSKANVTERQFISAVYYNLSKSPYEFAVDYVSSQYNVSPTLVNEISNFTEYSQYVNFVSLQASNESKLPQWFFQQLLYYHNISNLTAYLILPKLSKLQPILNASNITPKEFLIYLQTATNDSIYNLTAKLISNYVNFTPIICVNRSLLQEVLSRNESVSSLVSELIRDNEFPVTPIPNITDALYYKNYYLIIMKGNFTINEAKDFQNYVKSIIPLTSYLTGPKPIDQQLRGLANSAFAIAIPVGIALAIVITGIYFRSFVAAFVPLGIYLSAFLVSSVLIWLIVIKLLGITVDFLTPSQVLLLALGLGTDYVVFISSRYIEERRKGLTKDDAVKEAVRWGGRAVTLTALVVMLSFLFLYVYNVPLVSDTSISEMLAVFVVWLSATTLFTSILKAAGDKLFFPAKFNRNNNNKSYSVSRPVTKVGIFVALVVIFSIIALSMPLSTDILGLMPPSQASEGVNLLSQEFTTSNVFPIYVVVPISTFNQTTYDYAVHIYKELSSIPGVTAVESPVSPYGGLIPYCKLSEYNYSEYISHGYMLFVVNQKYPPFSTQAFGVVENIESLHVGYVGGGPVDLYNILHFIETDFLEIFLLITITMYVLLVIMTRSFSVSGVVIFTIMSAVGITLGLERLIFVNILGYGIFAVVPLFLVAIIIGIGMDYNIFLVARIHEEIEKGEDMETAVGKSVKAIGKTIIFLGLIFAGTMGSLMLVKAAILQEIGFALSVAAILETSLLWYYLGPSLLVLLYRKFKIRPKMLI